MQIVVSLSPTHSDPAPRPTGDGVSAARLREAMGHFATGVTVITTRAADGRPFGTTANAVSSVSLDPPLVLACLRRESETLAALRERGRFAVHVLERSQRELAERFSRRTEASTWDPVAHRLVRDVPLLPGGLATLHCDLHDAADGGDHEIVVGRVVSIDVAERNDVEPLLFFRGGFGQLARTPTTTTRGDTPVGSREQGGAITPATEVSLPSRRGAFRILSLSDEPDEPSVAILAGAPRGQRGVLLYAHDGCVLGDALGGMCPRRERLDAALSLIEREGRGVAVYHRDPRGAFTSCCFAGDAHQGQLSDAVIAAATRAVRELAIEDVRVLASASDAQRLSAAGVSIAEQLTLADPARSVASDSPPLAAAGFPTSRSWGD